MDFIISLAHFCEICGPTSTICTQIAPSNCTTCHPCVTPPTEDPSNLKWPDSSASSPTTRLADHMSDVSSPFVSPPTSPRTPSNSYNPYFPKMSMDGFAKRRFSEKIGTDKEGCDNCSFLVPEHVRARLPEGAPGSPTKDGRGRNGSPVLRSCESVLARGTPTAHREEDGSDSSDAEQSKSYPSDSSGSVSSVPSTSPSSPLSLPHNTHAHKLTYLSTRQPISPGTYSLLRRSYVRTFSCENLPKSSRSGSFMFGDHLSGYTIAYVFRLPDPRARGRLRTYALIALGGSDSRRVSRAFAKVVEHFESIAGQIIAMADRVLQRESPMSRPTTAIHRAPTTPLVSSSMPAVQQQTPEFGNSVRLTRTAPTHASSIPGAPHIGRELTPSSSFLTAKKVDPDGYPRVSREVMRAKGLAEILGKPDFFVALHAQFVMLLSGLIKEYGGGVGA